ncbi:site-specific integrase [Streptomyces sp. NPDC047085]|uniref:site-specific integrase n=1 Tax=Streptomyces sp. NPDC047085 TaxID=3155140 RepID=UPI0033D760D1
MRPAARPAPGPTPGRPLSLPAYLVRELREHLTARVAEDPEALLFLGRTGRPIRYNSWRRTHFDRAVDRAGLKDVTPQDLRATHASQVADRHGVMAAAKRLGHANASVTTRHYARSRDGQDAEIAKELNADHERAKRARARKAKRIKGDVARTLHEGHDTGSESDDRAG